MSFSLAISGPTGAGKSTLARMIGSHKGVTVVSEKIPDQLFRKFYDNPHRYCYSLQQQIIQNRAKKFKGANQQIRVIDRMVHEDIEVFANLHKELGFLNEKHVSELRDIATPLKKDLGTPDAIVFITAKPFKLRERMKTKSAPFFLIDSIDLQISLYKTWRNKLDGPILDIDNTSLSYRQLQNIADWIYGTLPNLISGEDPRFDEIDLSWKR